MNKWKTTRNLYHSKTLYCQAEASERWKKRMIETSQQTHWNSHCFVFTSSEPAGDLFVLISKKAGRKESQRLCCLSLFWLDQDWNHSQCSCFNEISRSFCPRGHLWNCLICPWELLGTGKSTSFHMLWFLNFWWSFWTHEVSSTTDRCLLPFCTVSKGLACSPFLTELGLLKVPAYHSVSSCSCRLFLSTWHLELQLWRAARFNTITPDKHWQGGLQGGTSVESVSTSLVSASHSISSFCFVACNS